MHCKSEAGYAVIQNVVTMEKNNRMEYFFLAETLKYLYLLQDDTNEIDLLNTGSEMIEFDSLCHSCLIELVLLAYYARMFSIQKLIHLDFSVWSRMEYDGTVKHFAAH